MTVDFETDGWSLLRIGFLGVKLCRSQNQFNIFVRRFVSININGGPCLGLYALYHFSLSLLGLSKLFDEALHLILNMYADPSVIHMC